MTKLRILWIRVRNSLDTIFGFPWRLLSLYWWVKRRQEQCHDFAIGEQIRLRETKGTPCRVMVATETAKDIIPDYALGDEDMHGNREWKPPNFAPGSTCHSFFEVRDPWRIIGITYDISVLSYLLRNLYPKHPCWLVIENTAVQFGEKILPYVPGDLVEKVP